MENNKNKILTIIAFSVLALMLIGGTYAFFAPQAGGTTSTNATVTSNTTDLLTFSINRDISFTVNQANFEENGQNQSGDATATATLTPNNKTGSATMNYYLYLNIESNPISYSSENLNGDPELMLQVFNSSNQLVTLSDLGSQVTIKGVTGYDITALEGLIVLLDNHAISASNNTSTIENWRVVITLINLDVNQNDNTGKEVEASINISRENPVTYVYWNDNFSDTTYSSSQVPTGSGLNGTYETRELLATAYSNWSNAPIYIKTTKVNGTVTGHTTCLWYNNHEFCIAPNYWAGPIGVDGTTYGATTKAKLKADMEASLGITINASSCGSGASTAYCYAGDFSCYADSIGLVSCDSFDVDEGCDVYGSGVARCS